MIPKDRELSEKVVRRIEGFRSASALVLGARDVARVLGFPV
jgi:hypothetical protein